MSVYLPMPYNASSELTYFLGPCQIESEDNCMRIAEFLWDNFNLPIVFKASYDKANRSRMDSPRGVGMDEGLRILEKIRTEFGFPVITDVHRDQDVEAVSEVADVIQIPAFLCRQTDLLCTVAKYAIKHGRLINIKKGQFLSPSEVPGILSKVPRDRTMITERGTSFGYNNLVVDMRSFRRIKKLCDNIPMIIDATHSIQLPGSEGSHSGGEREFAEDIAVASVTLGIAGVFMECHNDPDNALSDGANSIDLKDLDRIISRIENANHYIGRFSKV